MSEGRRGYVTVEEGVRLSYHFIENGEAVTIVPGACLLAADLMPLAQRRSLLFYDPRGRGGSDPPSDPWQIWTDYEVRDLEAIRRSFGFARVSLLGWSYLAGVAALYSLAYPQRVERLVLLSPIPPRYPAPYTDEAAEDRTAQARLDPSAVQRLSKMRSEGLDIKDPVRFCQVYNQVYLPRLMGNPQALERMRSDPSPYPNEWPDQLAIHWQSRFPDSSWKRDWREQLVSLEIPTLVVHGMQDLIPLEASREWVAALPEARLLKLEGAGHFPHLESPQVLPALDTFLSGAWPERAEIIG